VTVCPSLRIINKLPEGGHIRGPENCWASLLPSNDGEPTKKLILYSVRSDVAAF